MNPDSVKIYARMTKDEYSKWVDKLMAVRRIDTARTTNMPVMDAADALAMWGDELRPDKTGTLDTWTDHATGPTTTTPVAPSPLKRGDRVSVYWTDLEAWYTGTFTSSHVEQADGGGSQRASRIVYDAVDAWANCTTSQLTYWHCLDDELWNHADN